jgi:hypothetical protein
MPATGGAATGAAVAGTAAKGASAGSGAAKGAGAGGAGAASGGAKAGSGKLGSLLKRQAIAEASSRATDEDGRRQLVTFAIGLIAGFVLIVTLFVTLIVTVIFAPFTIAGNLLDLGRGLLDRIADGLGIPSQFMPVYGVAADHYDVNPFLLAAIHQQESSFGRSTLIGVSRRWNGCGAAGPMQFGVVGVRPYFATVPSCPNPAGAGGTWDAHKNAVDPIRAEIDSLRAEGPYLLARSALGSCRDVAAGVGCVYDSYDAIAGAAHKLSADGANASLYSEGTRQAVCAYIGSCSEVESCTGGPNQCCGVIPQAREWERLAEQIAAEEGASIGDGGGLVSNGGSGRLAWPTPPRYREITGAFGEDRDDHIHAGVDIPLPTGTPITAAESGRVTHACRNVTPCSGYGNFVCVEHNPRLSTCYAHLLDFARGIDEGAVVKRGEVIGPADSTGSSSGSHLHFEVRLGRYPAQPVDPTQYLGSAGGSTV